MNKLKELMSNFATTQAITIQGHLPFYPVNIPGYPQLTNAYAVNQVGEVLSLARPMTPRHPSHQPRSTVQRLLSPQKDGAGYYHYRLSLNNVTKLVKAHRLVMLTFAPIDNHAEMTVNHIDGNKLNNSLENLEWVTNAENLAHYLKMAKATGKKLGRNGLTPSQTDYIDNNYSTMTLIDMSNALRVTYTRVQRYAKKMGYMSKRQRTLAANKE